MENSTNTLRLVKMKAITTNEIGYFHGWGVHGGETVAIIELPNRVLYAKPKDFEFVDETHARLVSQNKYNHMEAHDEKLQNADGADADAGDPWERLHKLPGNNYRCRNGAIVHGGNYPGPIPTRRKNSRGNSESSQR